MKSNLTNNILRILATIVLVSLGSWSFYYNWQQRSIRFGNFTYSNEEAERFKNYPKALYAYGLNAWARQDPETAATFFRRAVSENVLYLDSWLRLADAEATIGRKEKAIKILEFSIKRTKNVSRWKWPQMLLARELGMEEVIYRNANYLLSLGVLEQDTLQFLHTYLGGNAWDVVAILEPKHLGDYLEWLIYWSMTEESLTVWQAMNKMPTPDKEKALKYAHFLLNNKHIITAMDIWKKYTGSEGLTNPGFEKEITGQGFDWRHWGEEDGNWELKRANYEPVEGGFALRITFNGRENISFYHVYQIFKVDPQSKYRLTYAWKSRGITTDQGPFIEIYGYDQNGLYLTGPKITGTQGWREVSLEFDIPEGCRGAVVRLCRRPSSRFDSKIRGSLWLDDFRLGKIERDSPRFSSATSAARLHQKTMQNENLYLEKR